MGARAVPFMSPLDPAIIAQSGLTQPQAYDTNALAFFRSKNGRSDGSMSDNQLQYLRSRTGLTSGSIADAWAEFQRQGLSYAAGGGTITNSTAPAVSGSTPQGSTLSLSAGTWSVTPDSYQYQWTRAGSNIAGATSSTYVTQAADVGNAVTCLVTAVKSGYSNSSPITATGAVTVTSAAQFTENWVQSAGTAFSASRWTNPSGGGSGTAVEQGGVGRITCTASPYVPTVRQAVMTASKNQTITTTVKAISTGVEQYATVSLDDSSPVTSYGVATSGIQFALAFAATSTASFIRFYQGTTAIGGQVTKTLAGGTTYTVVVQRDATGFRAKVYTGADPGTWDINLPLSNLPNNTDPTGVIGIGGQDGATGVARSFDFGPVSVA